ncbi:metallophosphoesterase [Methylibium sp.]|uniref:metallophosphoesterase n=1 Tax=Methylibium sp. TaxID=2067992 RepID=UPI003BAB9F62
MSQREERRGVQFNVIHLSDLHMGMTGQKWMWPTFKTIFFNDLRQQHEKTGPWDLVIFSGDLTQKSSPQEYVALTAALSDLWVLFNSLQCSPKLFVVPGNHDLQRPSTIEPCALALGAWWQTPDIHQDFWENAASPYRATVSKAFAAYTAWTASLAGTCIPLVADDSGFLPGDVSARIHKDGASLGLVGLNSAWLQLSDKNWFGNLNVHARQLLSVTRDDPDSWVASNAFNLLVTHHPTTWLHADAITHWNAEIHANARFGAHLFGHMHESVAGQFTVNGSTKKLAIQAPSIFGLETLASGEQRNHGYSFLRLIKTADERTLKIWPRFAFPLKDGARRLIADPNWDLKDDACEFDLHVPAATRSTSRATAPQDGLDMRPDVSLIDNAGARRILGSLRKSNAHSRAAASVRNEEQQFLLAALSTSRQGWLVDTWGTGGDEFINVVCTRILGTTAEIYYLHVGSFDGQEAFLASVRPRVGCSLEELWHAMDQRPCVLVLDDVSFDGGNRSQLEQELLFIVRTLLDLSEHLRVIVRSRSRPADPGLFTQLRPLDEADVTAYVTSHEQTATLPPDAIARIFRHSGGLPTRIDAILRAIDVVGTQALYDLDVDIVGKAAARPDDIPQALVDAIQELIDSDDEHSRRSAMLLKVLSLFPQGEPLARVRRFFGAKAFYASHATLLLERGLIDSNPITSLEGAALSQEQGNALTVRRPVREYLVQSLPAAELKGLNSKALALYFGDNWTLRGIQSPPDLKFSSARRGALEIDNASTLILREARAATESQNHGRVKAALALSESFVGQLAQGDHFRGVAQFLDGAAKIFEDYVSAKALEQATKEPLSLASLLHSQARALRMIDQVERAHQIASEISLDGLSNAFKESTLLTIALCKQSLNAPAAEIIAAADACRRVNPKGRIAVNARHIIVQNDQSPDKTTRLRALYDEARKKRCVRVANNIALELAETASDPEQKKLHLKDALASGRSDNDHYNFVRALLRASRLAIDESGTLTRQQFDDCARAYSYLYNERIDGLFESCHRILWDVFKAQGDEQNLLTLYRYSSLVWRLRRKTEMEQKYRNALTTILGSRLSKSILAADRELRYFISHGASSAGELPRPQS